ncbi:MAG: hypothetical protein CL867_04830 [Cytophagaceae bacterium]|nr:hypothetical protein [Cytophagaceae bacterium]
MVPFRLKRKSVKEQIIRNGYRLTSMFWMVANSHFYRKNVAQNNDMAESAIYQFYPSGKR